MILLVNRHFIVTIMTIITYTDSFMLGGKGSSLHLSVAPHFESPVRASKYPLQASPKCTAK